MTPTTNNQPMDVDNTIKNSKSRKRSRLSLKRKISEIELNTENVETSPKHSKNIEADELIIKDEIIENNLPNGSPEKNLDKFSVPRTYSLSLVPDLTNDEEAKNNMILKYKNKTRSNSICSTVSATPNKRSPRFHRQKSENEVVEKVREVVILDTSVTDSQDYLQCGQRCNGNADEVREAVVLDTSITDSQDYLECGQRFNNENDAEGKENDTEERVEMEISYDELRVSEEEELENDTTNAMEIEKSPQENSEKPNEVSSLDVEAAVSDNDTSDTSIVSDKSDQHKIKSIPKVKRKKKEDAVEEYMRRGCLGFDISPTWDVPRQHMIETRLVRAPTESQREDFRELGVQMKNGPFNPEEDQTIRNNFEFFCEEYGLEKNPELYLNRNIASRSFNKTSIASFSRHQRLAFGRYLAKDLPHRYLYSVFARFQMLYQTITSQGRYTEQEDKSLIEFINNSSSHHKFAIAAELLGRRKQSVAKRYYALTCEKYENKSLTWTKKEIVKLIESLISRCKVEEVTHLRDYRITKSIWLEIAEEFKVSPNALRHFWYGRLASQLFATRDFTLSEIRIKLVKLFRKAQIKSSRDIRWQEVEKHFDGLTSMFLWQKFDKLVKHRVPDHRQKSFEEILDYLQHQVVPQLKCSPFDRLLRRCTYSQEDGLVFMT